MSPEELEFWAEVERLLNPTVSADIEYRLHYNDLGEIVSCTMQQHPDSTQYVIVDRDTYENYFRYRVNVDKKQLIKLDQDSKYRVKLKRSNSGFPTVAGHAGLVIEKDEVYNNVEYYEPNN
jgi:hypothetical protein